MKLTLINKKEEAPDVITFIWKTSEPFTWQAGQYLHYVLPHKDPDDRKEERWFTISSAPFEGHVAITTRFDPKGSTFKKSLHDLKIGQTIEADALEGDFVITDESKEYVLIAGGIGITPFHSILLDLDHKGVSINAKLLYANRDTNIVFKEELEALAKRHPNFKIKYFLNPNRIDEKAIREEVPDLSKPIFYISGPAPMVFAFEKMLSEMGVAKDHIKLDDFPGYVWPN